MRFQNLKNLVSVWTQTLRILFSFVISRSGLYAVNLNSTWDLLMQNTKNANQYQAIFTPLRTLLLLRFYASTFGLLVPVPDYCWVMPNYEKIRKIKDLISYQENIANIKTLSSARFFRDKVFFSTTWHQIQEPKTKLRWADKNARSYQLNFST